MAVVEQLGDDSWSVICAAWCHMTLVFAIIRSYDIFDFLFLSIPFYQGFLNFYLVSINQMERATVPACPSLTCFF